jgi:hypothetical protein
VDDRVDTAHRASERQRVADIAMHKLGFGLEVSAQAT